MFVRSLFGSWQLKTVALQDKMKRAGCAVPGLNVKRCSWVKQTMPSSAKPILEKRSVLPCWILLWSLSGSPPIVTLWALLLVSGLVYSSAEQDFSDFSDEERAQYALLCTDTTCASKLVDNPMVSWELLECCPLSRTGHISKEQLRFEHTWLNAERLEPDVLETLKDIRVQGGLPQRTVGEVVGSDVLYCFRYLESLCKRVVGKHSAVL